VPFNVKLIVLPLTPEPPEVKVAERFTVPPYVPLAGVTDKEVLSLALKVAVSACVLFPMLKVQGFVVPVQVVDPGLVKLPLQPTNTEPVAGLTVKVPVASLCSCREQVAGAVAVQAVGVVPGVTDEKEMVPPPVPANIISRPLSAILYGPTNGPPSPTGAAPAGCISSMLVSSRARSILTRPFPVCSCVPAGSAVRARRPTITPLVKSGSTAFIKAATPATIAEDADVPLITT
jgi:hypothetical protein